MSDSLFPQEILILLDPIQDKNEDLVLPDMSPNFINLEAEMNKIGQVNYIQCITWAQEILIHESKHLRVVGWLTLSWLRKEGLAGFRKGLILLNELLKKFSNQLHPEKLNQQSKAIQYLNSEKRIHTYLKQIPNTTENSEILIELIGLLEEISKECNKIYMESTPDLSAIIRLMIEKANIESAASVLRPQLDEQIENSKLENKRDTETSSSNLKSIDIEKEHPAEDILAPVDDRKESIVDQPQERDELAIPQEVKSLLQDITEELPVGEDAEKTENQNTIVLYMKLETEMSKYSGNDYIQCINWGREIIQEKSKHLRVAIWLLIAWFRVEGLPGLKNGLLLLLELLKKYGTALYPSEETQKVKIIQLLNTDARLKLIEKIEFDGENCADFLEIGEIINAICSESSKLFAEKAPNLKVLRDTITDFIENYKGGLNNNKSVPKTINDSPQKILKNDEKPKSETTERKNIPEYPKDTAVPIPNLTPQIISEKSAQILIKKALVFFFEEETNNEKKRKIPDDVFIYALSRVYRWGKVKFPVNVDNVAELGPPIEQKKNYIEKLLNNQEWEIIIPEIEVNFLNLDEFIFWFDAQRMVVQALEKKGGRYKNCACEIKFQLAKLIDYLPGIQKLLFKDQKTPLADEVTLRWLEEQVINIYGVSKTKDKIMPPIIGEDYDPINKDYEKVCEELPNNFETNVKEMQSAIAGDVRPKGRFLRLLNLANYCYLAKQYSIARVLFNQLLEQIEEYNIAGWEQALCLAAWRSVYINNQKLLNNNLLNHQMKDTVEKQQNELFDRIGKYDSVLALSLTNQTQNEGE